MKRKPVRRNTTRTTAPCRSPLLLYADEKGRILEHPRLEATGADAGRWCRPSVADWIPLPEGSEVFRLPMRLPVGFDRRKKRFEVLSRDPYDPRRSVNAVAAFVAPAHTQLHSAAYQTLPGAPVLPLFAYTAVGWMDGGFVTTALRVDPDRRQDFTTFDLEAVQENARRRLAGDSHNRLIPHLAKCALTYACPAARNLFLNRWEAPLPTSPTCNARCLGCISLQETGEIPASQERIRFVPTPEEIAAVAVPHLKTAPRAVVSFGQGCEGEPLLQGDTLREAVRIMRRETGRGTINCNTNGSLPDVVSRLVEAGLDSIRVSINSCRPRYYNAYYNPRGYRFDDLKRSIQAVKAAGGFASLNYFVLPGFSDEESEAAALFDFVRETGVDLIQMRNFNIDPEWLLEAIGHRREGKVIGVRRLMQRLQDEFPGLRLGYFNPCLDPDAGSILTHP